MRRTKAGRRLRLAASFAATTFVLTLMPTAWADSHHVVTARGSDRGQLLADPTHGLLFYEARDVSIPLGTPDLEIFDASGTSLETFATDWGGGMALAGNTLYVTGDDAVERFDLTQNPPTQLAPLTLTKMWRPYSIVSAGGLLWIAECLPQAAVESVNPSTGAEASRSVPEAGYCPQFTDDPANANVFYMWDRYNSTFIYRVDVSSGSFVATASWQAPASVTDVAVTPGGGPLVVGVSGGGPVAGAVVLNATTMVPTGVTYEAGKNVSAVSISADGHVATAEQNTIRVHPSGVATPNATWVANGCQGGWVDERGLAFGPAAATLFAAVQSGQSLVSLSNPTTSLASPSLSLTPSTLTPVAGDAVTLNGALTNPGGPVSGRVLKIYEGGSLLGSVTTDAGGAFTVDVTPATPTYHCYEARFASTATATGAQQSVTLEAGQVVSTLTLSGPPTPPAPDQPVALSGTLSFADGASVAGKTVLVEVSSDGAVFAPVADVTVAADGTFDVSDTAGPEGGYVYRATYDGTDRYGSAQVRLNVGVGRWATALSLSASAHHTVYGHPITLTAHVDLLPGTKKRMVTFVRQIDLRKPEPVGKATVAPNGVAKLKIMPSGSATYTANYGGDARNLDSHDDTFVSVQVRLLTRMVGSSGKSGDYHLYHRGVAPGYVVAVGPAGRANVLFYLQRRVHGAWHTFARTGVHTKAAGIAAVAVNPDALRAGVPYRLYSRVREGHVGQEPVLGADSAYSYFRVSG